MNIFIKYLCCFLYLCLFIQNGFCQSYHTDTAKINRILKEALAAYPNRHEDLRRLTQNAFEASQKIAYRYGLAQSYYLQGLFYKLRSDYDEQLHLIILALKIFQELNNQEAIARTYNEIGSVHIQQGNFEEAKTAVETALKIYRQTKNLQGQTNSLLRLGNAYADRKDYPNAIAHYEEALKIQEILKNNKNMGNIFNNLGVVYYELKDYAKAMDYYEKSFALIQKVKLKERYSASYYNRGMIYLAQNQTDKAISFGKKALEWAGRLNNKQGRREACLLLADVYAQQKSYKEAYLFEKEFKAITDSIYNIESRSEIARIQSLYDLESKEQKIRLLSQEKKIAKFWFYGILGSVLLGLVITLLIIYYQRTKIRKNHEIIAKNLALHEAEQALKQAELENQTLKTQALENHLDFKNKELTTFTLHFAQKNNMIQDIRQGIQEIINQTDKNAKMRLNRLINLIDHTLNTDNDWEDFKLYFEQVHKGFFEKLKEDHPELSNSELRLCALMRLNLNSKEVSNILGISPESVKMARYRLRKKLNLGSEKNLNDFMLQY